MVFEAGLVSFVRTLLIFVLIYYAFKLVIRFLFPIILNWFLKKNKNQFHNDSNTANTNSSKKANKSRTEKLGDYVDYEEVEE